MHAASSDHRRRDYIADIDLALYERDFRTQPRVWRRIRVSGGISLAALQDKVLGPAMVRACLVLQIQPVLQRA